MGATALGPWTWFAWRDVRWEPIAFVSDIVGLLAPLLATVSFVVLVAVAAVRPTLPATFAWGAAACSCLVFGAAATIGPWLPNDGPDPVSPTRLVAANLRFGNTSADAVGDLLGRSPDILVIAETNGSHYLDLVSQLGPPDASGGGGTGCSIPGPGGCDALNVWSEYPIRVAGDQSTATRLRGLRLEADTPGGRVVVFAVHPEAPYRLLGSGGRTSPSRLRSLLDELVEAVERESRPVVVVGDLNVTDRQSGYRQLAGTLKDAMRDGVATPTASRVMARPLLARLDHMFIDESWCSAATASFTVSGSDHRGISADIGPCPDEDGAAGPSGRH